LRWRQKVKHKKFALLALTDNRKWTGHCWQLWKRKDATQHAETKTQRKVGVSTEKYI